FGILVALALIPGAERLTLPRDFRPPLDHAQAVDSIRALQASEGPDISPVCRTALLDHGTRAPRVVLLLHALTNCPAQFPLVGEECYRRGANVLIPRPPGHGLADRRTKAIGRVRAGAAGAVTG